MTIKKQSAFIEDNSMTPVYDTEERDIAKFAQLLENAQYIQNIESKYQSNKRVKISRSRQRLMIVKQ